MLHGLCPGAELGIWAAGGVPFLLHSTPAVAGQDDLGASGNGEWAVNTWREMVNQTDSSFL